MNPRYRKPPTRSPAALLLAAVLLPAGCGGGDRTHEIEKTRVVSDRGVELNAPDWRRLRFRQGHGAADSSQAGALKPRFTFEVPAGWEQQPSRPFREVNLKVGEDVECYVSTVTGGGLAANVNRWRKQMGLEPFSAAELQALPRRKVLGREGVRVECAGTFTPMRGGKKPGYKLHALYVEFPAFAVSVKMVGPTAAVDAARKGFEKFADSLGIDMSAPGREAAAGSAGSDEAGGGFDRSKLRWDAPSGWQPASGSSIRIVTFKIDGKTDGDPGAECWVTDLSGRAGGIVDNINRWRREIGKPPLSAQDVDRLPRLEILGEQAPLLEAEGSYRGMGGPRLEEAVLFGVVCPLSGVTLFIKMVGGPETMREAKNDFVKFCRSLRLES